MPPIGIVALVFIVAALCGARGGHASGAAVLVLTAVLVGSAIERTRRWRTLLILGAAALCGYVRGGEIPALRPRPRIRGDTGLLAGRIERGCERDGDGVVCRVVSARGLVQVRFPLGACEAMPGDEISAVAEFQPVAPDVNGARAGPGASLALAGVVAVARAERCELSTGPPTAWGPLTLLRRIALRTRQALGRGLAAILAADTESQSRALLFGDASALDPDDVRAFRESGLAHLLAVSGAHVALLAGAVGAVVRALARRVARLAARGWVMPLGGLVPLPFVTVFVFATGESPSAVRALVAAVLSGIAVACGRRARGEAIVAASALITLAARIANVLDVGWQLSIAASWMLAASPRGPSPDGKSASWPTAVLRAWHETLVASARVACAVAPILAWHFQRTPLVALLANAIAAPLAEAVALPLVLTAGLAGIVAGPSAAFIAHVVQPVLHALFAMPHFALALPGATTVLPPPTPTEATLLVVGVLVGIRFRARGRAVLAIVVLACLVPLELAHLRFAHPTGLLRVTAIDVGQGDALLIDLPDGAAMLIDAGGAVHMGSDPGERVVIPFLADRRRRDLVAVVASHPHPDHVGGLAAVLAWAHTESLWDTRQGEGWQGSVGSYARMRRAAANGGVPVLGPESLCGGPRAFHGAVLEVIAPCPRVDPAVGPNDASFVIRLRMGRASALFPGDLERGGEARILERIGSSSTLLKVPHHGSRTSSTDALLDRVRPGVAVASAGHPSRFDHPDPEVIERYRSRGVAWWSTAEHGGVSVTLHPDGSFEATEAD